MEKEELLNWLEYVKKTLEEFVGIQKDKEHFEKCYYEIYNFIEKEYPDIQLKT